MNRYIKFIITALLLVPVATGYSYAAGIELNMQSMNLESRNYSTPENLTGKTQLLVAPKISIFI